MQLSQEHIEIIRAEVRRRGITIPDLSESLVDHICCLLENDMEGDFLQRLEEVIKSFDKVGLINIQEKTYYLTLKNSIIMKKTIFLSGYLSAFLVSTGVLFKIQQWPGAMIILTLGICLLNFGFLPLFFYDRYKKAVG